MDAFDAQRISDRESLLMSGTWGSFLTGAAVGAIAAVGAVYAFHQEESRSTLALEEQLKASQMELDKREEDEKNYLAPAPDYHSKQCWVANYTLDGGHNPTSWCPKFFKNGDREIKRTEMRCLASPFQFPFVHCYCHSNNI